MVFEQAIFNYVLHSLRQFNIVTRGWDCRVIHFEISDFVNNFSVILLLCLLNSFLDVGWVNGIFFEVVQIEDYRVILDFLIFLIRLQRLCSLIITRGAIFFEAKPGWGLILVLRLFFSLFHISARLLYFI